MGLPTHNSCAPMYIVLPLNIDSLHAYSSYSVRAPIIMMHLRPVYVCIVELITTWSDCADPCMGGYSKSYRWVVVIRRLEGS